MPIMGTQEGCWARLLLWFCREQLTDVQARCCVLVGGLGWAGLPLSITKPPKLELTPLPMAVDMY